MPNYSLMQRFVCLIFVTVLAGCGGHGGNQESSGLPPVAQASAGLATAPEPLSLKEQGVYRSAQSIKLIGCPKDIPCVEQGGTISIAWFHSGETKDGALQWNTTLQTKGITSAFLPPVTISPHSTSQSVKVAPSVPVGIYDDGVFVTYLAYGSSSATKILPLVICDGITGRCPSLVAPVPSKPAYSAQRTAHVVIPFSEAGSDGSAPLRWNVSGYPNTFKNVGFAQPLSVSPHANSLVFDVDVDAVPGDYNLNVSVTSTSSQRTSPIGQVKVAVQPVLVTFSIKNPDHVYIEDQNGMPLKDDGSVIASTGTPQLADFSGSTGGVQTASSQQRSIEGGKGVTIARCDAAAQPVGTTIESQDGKTPLKLVFKVDCINATPVAVIASVSGKSVDVDKTLLVDQKLSIPCVTMTTSANGNVKSCVTKTLPFPYSSKAATRVVMTADIEMIAAGQQRNTVIPAYVYLNTLGAPYPTISFDGGSGALVPFPAITRPLANCPLISRGTSTCPSTKSKDFRSSTVGFYRSANYSVPNGITELSAGGYQNHHVLPLACGGGDTLGNGRFLKLNMHTPFTTWWKYVPPCASGFPTILDPVIGLLDDD